MDTYLISALESGTPFFNRFEVFAKSSFNLMMQAIEPWRVSNNEPSVALSKAESCSTNVILAQLYVNSFIANPFQKYYAKLDNFKKKYKSKVGGTGGSGEHDNLT